MNEPGTGPKSAVGAGASGGGDSGASGSVIVTSESLLRGAREILIRHGVDTYRLRSTSKGKLILTK